MPDLSGGSPNGKVVAERAKRSATRSPLSYQHRGFPSWETDETVSSPQFRNNRDTRHGKGRLPVWADRIYRFLGLADPSCLSPLRGANTSSGKSRVLAGWLASLRFGRDIVSVEDARHPRAAFVHRGIPQSRSTFDCDEGSSERDG